MLALDIDTLCLSSSCLALHSSQTDNRFIGRMKALLFSLVRSFEFELAVPKEEIISRISIVQKPYLKGQVDLGSQLPLNIHFHSGH